MRIDGKTIANQMLAELADQVRRLKGRGITPTLAVIQVGDDPGSTAYINQKKKAAEIIGAVVKHDKLPINTSLQHVNTLIQQYNADSAIHGIIVQQPLPKAFGDISKILDTIYREKDVDGFLPNSAFEVPVVLAVMEILKQIRLTRADLVRQSIVVIGRGEIGGKPIAEHLRKLGCKPMVVHSKTQNPDDAIRSADIVISCVGKPNVVRRDNIKKSAILIGVGLWRDTAGNLHGDYEEKEIKDLVSFYTPTPGGVGPINVAALMQNLVKVCILQMGGHP